MTVRITNEILYDIADLADNIEENFGSQYADVFEQEVTENLQNLGERFNQYPGTGISTGEARSGKLSCALL